MCDQYPQWFPAFGGRFLQHAKEQAKQVYLMRTQLRHQIGNLPVGEIVDQGTASQPRLHGDPVLAGGRQLRESFQAVGLEAW